MRRLIVAALVATGVVVAVPHNGFAWNATGHRVVAAIAWANMTPQARSEAVRLLLLAPAKTGIASLRPNGGTSTAADEELFIAAATWPDLIKSPGASHVYSHPAWHFADHFWKISKRHPTDLPSMGPAAVNAGGRLAAFEHDFEMATTQDTTKAIELAWMLHLMGDIHEPLHSSSRVTTALPNGDRGGNAVVLAGTVNLHSFWDDILDEVYEASAPGTLAAKRAHEKTPDYIFTWVGEIGTRFPQSAVSLGSSVDAFETWEIEGLHLAETRAYKNVTPHHPPTTAYRNEVDAVSEQAIAEAGYRLATLLNTLLH
jgi:hypothetical protein